MEIIVFCEAGAKLLNIIYIRGAQILKKIEEKPQNAGC
jgi:hypothetical protein